MTLATGSHVNTLAGEWGAQESAGGRSGRRPGDEGPPADRRQAAAGTCLA